MGLRERKKAQLIKHIQTVTINLIKKVGYDAVTVDAIVQTVEISPPTFYKYFSSKDDVLRWIANGFLYDSLTEFVAADRGETMVRGQLIKMFEHLSQLISNDRELWRAIVLADAFNPFRWPEQRDHERDLMSNLEQLFGYAQAQQECGKQYSAEFLAHSLLSLQVMTLLNWSAAQWSQPELLRHFTTAIDFVYSAAGTAGATE